MPEYTATHKCPKNGCEVRVPLEQLACRPHWYSLPKPLRDDVWRTYRDGRTEAHKAAMAEALRFLNA